MDYQMTTLSPATFFDTKHKTADAMTQFGGGFVQGLAIALRRADRHNAAVLQEAFADLIAPYAPGGRFHQE